MAKPKAQNNRTLYVLVLGGLAALAIGYVATEPPSTDAKTIKAPPHTFQGGSANANSLLITKADYEAHFASISTPVRDAFQPLVVRQSSLNGKNGTGIPTNLAGGQAAWQYTGMVTINGKPEALLENTKTDESDYLGIGDHWKTCTVHSISDAGIGLAGFDGQVSFVKMGGVPTAAPVAGAPTGNVPAQVTLPPGLTGPIGPLQATPMGAPGVAAAGAVVIGRPGRRRRGG